MAAARYSTDVLQETYEPIEREVEPPQRNLVDVDSQTIDEAIQNLPPEIREIIYKEFVSTKIRERKEMGWNEVHNGIERSIKIRERKEMGWNEVHNHIEGAPFFSCENFYYTDDYLSNFDLEEIFNLDPAVLEQLLEQPYYEEQEEPPQNMSLQEELEEIDPEDLEELMVDYLITKPEDLVKVEEELKKEYPAIMGEITKNKHAILPLCRKLLRMCLYPWLLEDDDESFQVLPA